MAYLVQRAWCVSVCFAFAAAAGAVLKPQGGNCAVLPLVWGCPGAG